MELLKFPVAVTVMMDVPLTPGLVLTRFGFAEREKSAELETVNVRTAGWVKVPLVAVTVTVKMPGEGLLHVSVDVPVALTLVGLSEQTRPVVGLTVAVRDIVPLNPPIAVNVIVEEPVACGLIVTVLGFVVTVKSGRGTITEIVIVGLLLTREPDVALMIA
jgi:hypothetical protein